MASLGRAGRARHLLVAYRFAPDSEDPAGRDGRIPEAQLDFCCGGRVPLTQAATERGIDLGGLVAELDGVVALSLPAERPEGTLDLIDLIETRYHATHRRELPKLVRLARRVEAVHKAHPSVPRGIAALLERMSGELDEVHMKKEELILFPMLQRGSSPMIAQPIVMTLAEHDDHGVHLRELEALTNDFAAPGDACATWRALYVGAKKLAE